MGEGGEYEQAVDRELEKKQNGITYAHDGEQSPLQSLKALQSAERRRALVGNFHSHTNHFDKWHP